MEKHKSVTEWLKNTMNQKGKRLNQGTICSSSLGSSPSFPLDGREAEASTSR